MTLEGKGKYYYQEKRGGSIRLPSKIVHDSAFFLKNRDVIKIKLNPRDKTIIITKIHV